MSGGENEDEMPVMEGGKKKKSLKKKLVKRKLVKRKKMSGGENEDEMPVMEGGKKKKSLKKKLVKRKKMSGGMETMGATPMDLRFFDAKLNSVNYNSNSGNGIQSAYGPIKVGDVGTGMLAPYTASKSLTANHNTMMKTGGYKIKKMKKMKGSGPIPRVSDGIVRSTRDTINGSIDGFIKTMNNLEAKYNKSIVDAQNVKIGEQRLLGGSKKNNKKNNKKNKMKGGDGSDFALTLNSRGPENAPDKFWGVDGEKWFRQFNKTGD
jgi:hypothetical protein